MYHIQHFKLLFMYFALLKFTHPPSSLPPKTPQVSPHFLTFSHLPKAQVQNFKAGELRDPLQSPLSDFRTSIQIDAGQLRQVVCDQLQSFVCNPHALADVQRPQLVHLAHHPVDAIVTDVARAQRQRLELVQALRDISQALVAYLVAKRHVESRESQRAHGEVHDARVADVVARTQIKAPQARHVREVDHASIRDAPAETQVEHFELGQAFRNVLEGQVRQLLAILQGQVFQTEAALRRAPGHASQVPYAHIRNMPAAPQIKTFESVQTPRDEQQARVRDVTAAAQFQHLQVFQILRYSAQTGVRDLLAKAQIEHPQGRDLLHERVPQAVIR